MPKSILIITSEYYGSANKIGSHQLAEQFSSSGIATYIISFPISPIHKLFETSTNYGERRRYSDGWKAVQKNLYCYIPKTLFLPPLPQIIRFWSNYLTFWIKTVPKIDKILNQMKFDLVINESLFFNGLLSDLTYDKLVVRLPDNLQGFWKTNSALLHAQQTLLDKSDLVVSPSTLLLDALPKKYRTMYLPNGVNFNLSKQLDIKSEHPYRNLPQKYHAVYVGAIQKWFDHDLLIEIAKKKLNWSFTIIGKLQSKNDVQYPKNVYFLGEIQNKNMFSYLVNATAGIIPFETKKNKQLVRYVNPLKLYEYLLAGIPVVSTKWEELERISAPIDMCSNHVEFSCALTKLETSKSDKKAKEEFLAQYAWPEIANSLLQELNKY